MPSVTSRELKQNYGRYRVKAHQEPVYITNHGKDDLVLLSVDEYNRLRQLEKRAFYVTELTDDDLTAFDHVEIPDEAKAFNHEAR